MNLLAHRIFLVFSILGLILVTACSDDDNQIVNLRPFAEESFSFNVVRQGQTALQLEAISGTVEVTGIPGATSISITGIRRVEADTVQDATTHLAELEVEVDNLSPTELNVRTVQPNISAGRNYIVNYIISIPQDFAVDVANIGGAITVRSITNDCTISSISGPIYADAITGSTVLSQFNGQITASVTLPPAGQIDVSVLFNGNIDLAIPKTTSAQFSATVGTGRITLTNLSLSNDTVMPGSRTGTLGGGNGTISLNVWNGSVAVRGF